MFQVFIFYVRAILRMVSSVNEKKMNVWLCPRTVLTSRNLRFYQQVETEVGHEVITSATNVPQQL